MQVNKRDLGFIAVIGVVLALLLVSTGRGKPKKVPADERHRAIPLPQNHPPKEQCLICHLGKLIKTGNQEENMQTQELAKKMKSRQAPCVLDVRSGIEFRTGHIPSAVHAPFWKILLRMAALPEEKDAQVVVTCEHGPRAMLAKSLLDARGYKNVELLDGHMAGWRRVGLPLER